MSRIITPEDFFRETPVVVLCDNVWGDNGKGKLDDILAAIAHANGRVHGGGNAGNTVYFGDIGLPLHIIPPGIRHDADGKISFIGKDVANDLQIAEGEICDLDKHNLPYNNLRMSLSSHAVLPQHKIMDRIKELRSGNGKIGTTGKGIGPAYTDFVARDGIKINDLLNKDLFVSRLDNSLSDKLLILKCDPRITPEHIAKVFEKEDVKPFYSPTHIFDRDAIIEEYTRLANKFRPFMTDTDKLVRELLRDGKFILIAGSHGLLLSRSHGSYPYVTSSDCSGAGAAHAGGVPAGVPTTILGLIKAYLTRVGEGACPTEYGGKQSAIHCDTTKTYEQELLAFPNPDINSADPMERGAAIRRIGKEFGATTGRPRRTGAFDAPLARYAAEINGPKMIMTKVDALDTADYVDICTHYIWRGEATPYGDRTIMPGEKIDVAIPGNEFLDKCEAVYERMPGWRTKTEGLRNFSEAPSELKAYVARIEQLTGARIVGVSTGPKHEDMAWREAA